MTPSTSVVLQFPVRPKLKLVQKNILTRLKNSAYRSREYLTEKEVEKLMVTAGSLGRHGQRDATLIMLAYRHGLRVTELINLRWEQVDMELGLLHVNRLKRGTASVHPLRESECAALRKLQETYPLTPHVFSSERMAPLSSDGFRKIISRAGKEAKLPFSVHPHMLRHACGYKLAQAGQDTRAIQHYLGHRNIQHTVRYTQLSAERFKDFWND